MTSKIDMSDETYDLLAEIKEFLEGQADAEINAMGALVPNEAMRLLKQVKFQLTNSRLIA